eukprot:TRINITY_DN4083_c0_g1_i2.p1 TRINITY_DN4083_c0_g1~~TRINITY_DN4083_c0_g1_i2.p1  ORF type:complete len:350 (-),score=95.99 TRINITY_DN4083_c0_g1_i2:31-1080(-)
MTGAACLPFRQGRPLVILVFVTFLPGVHASLRHRGRRDVDTLQAAPSTSPPAAAVVESDVDDDAADTAAANAAAEEATAAADAEDADAMLRVPAPVGPPAAATALIRIAMDSEAAADNSAAAVTNALADARIASDDVSGSANKLSSQQAEIASGDGTTMIGVDDAESVPAPTEAPSDSMWTVIHSKAKPSQLHALAPPEEGERSPVEKKVQAMGKELCKGDGWKKYENCEGFRDGSEEEGSHEESDEEAATQQATTKGSKEDAAPQQAPTKGRRGPTAEDLASIKVVHDDKGAIMAKKNQVRQQSHHPREGPVQRSASTRNSRSSGLCVATAVLAVSSAASLGGKGRIC